LDIISDNKDYPLQILAPDELNILGKVVGSFGKVY
jgi:phage repressor protein C with HTH and peptisase S24 domain